MNIAAKNRMNSTAPTQVSIKAFTSAAVSRRSQTGRSHTELRH